MVINIGASGSATVVVSDADTAVALGSGDVPVLGTPRVVALMEEAAVDALRGSLESQTTSVGTRIAVDHLAASFVGAVVRATAEVVEVDERSVVFDLSAHEEDRLIASGRHSRVVVDRGRFLRTRS